ncbi:MAG TPA: hypothetical protein VHE30_14895 [Polyangiaceae bacterium]|nr:hypothetical protein [Polyangiaceae bacterium]
MIEPRVAPPGLVPRKPASAFSLYGESLRDRPVGASLGLVVEWLMFFSAVVLALGLFATRVPLRLLDGALGLRLRERFVDFIAKVSPG